MEHNSSEASDTIKPKSQRWLLITFLIICGTIFAGLTSIFCLKLKRSTSFVSEFYTVLHDLTSNHTIEVYGVLHLLQVVNSMFFLPFQVIIGIFSVLVMDNSLFSYIFVLSSVTLNSIAVFFLINFKFLNFISKDPTVVKLISMVNQEAQKHPFKASFAVSMMFLPMSVKDALLGILRIPLNPYMLSMALNNAFYILKVYLVAIEISSVEELINPARIKTKKPINYLLIGSFFVMILVTIYMTTYFSIKANQFFAKDKESKKAFEETETRENSEIELSLDN